jgi:ubiquinone/menaquinone biosynthesis C-methylase UbiE
MTGADSAAAYILEEVDKRYSQLADGTCCLSCGTALDLGKPAAGEVCVDIGCGKGNDVLKMAVEVGETGFAYGIDISAGMIEKSRKTAKRLGVTNAEFIHTQLEDLKLADETADLVISNCTINHAPDKDAVWKEVYRVLKYGGRFVVSDIYAVESVPETYAGDPEAVAECWGGAVTRDVYMNTLVRTGFKEIRVLEESLPYLKGKIMVSSFTVCGWKKKK